ncbi:MAG: membrane protein insertase YidC [Rickettsiales bacterium]|jgi:YidC/Oxa1 family membrane protein insertase|nr:membrane protein insertase YidC [Rickettsiales bacterium]
MVQYINNNPSGFAQFSKMQNAANDNANPNAKKGGLGFVGWMLIFLAAYWMLRPADKPAPANAASESEQVDISNVPRATISDDDISAAVQGIRISNINLNDYKQSQGEVENVELLSDEKEFVEIGFLADGTDAPKADSLWKSTRAANGGTMIWRAKSGNDFRRVITSEGYVINVADEIRNGGRKPIFVSVYARIVRAGAPESKFAVRTGGIAGISGDIENETFDDIAKRAPIYQQSENQSPFVGFTDQYWQVVAASAQASDKTINIKQRADKLFQAEIKPEFIKIEPGKTAKIETNIFAGPKTQAALAAAAGKIHNLDRTLDYGWFGFLSRPFLWTLEKLHGLVPSWGIAIILLTLILRGLMWPLTKKSFLSMRAMSKIQPELKRIQAQFGNDKMRMQQEIMRLYQTHKLSPFGSIGIMFLQIPIFFALYKALLIAVPLRHAGFLWLPDLSAMDPYFILPILMAASMIWQNRLNGQGSDAPGAKMMKYMPYIFGVMFAWMPSGLVLYWLVSNLAGIGQILWLKKKE